MCTLTHFVQQKVMYIVGGGLPPSACPAPAEDTFSTLKSVFALSFDERIKEWTGKSINAKLIPKELKFDRYAHACCQITLEDKH